MKISIPTLDFKTCDVEVGGVKLYVIREFDGTARSAHLKKIRALTGDVKDENVAEAEKQEVDIEAYMTLQYDLLSKTMHDLENKLVTMEFLKGLGAGPLEALYAAAAEVCGLGVKAEEQAKNASEAKSIGGGSSPSNSECPSANANEPTPPQNS